MKANPGQFGNAIDRAGSGGSDIRLFLLYGPDEAGAMDHAARLGRAMPVAERVDLDGPTLKSRPGLLADEAASLSLFGEARYIRVTSMGEESVEAVQLLLDATSAGNPVIAMAPTVKATGKLVKMAVAAPSAMALACYVPDSADAARIASTIAREHGIRLLAGVASALADAATNDRAILTREIEKLALYLDAAPDRPREADEATLAAIGANIDESGMGSAIEAVIDGQPARLGAELASLEAANMAIPMLRGLARRLVALADMRGEVDAGTSPDAVVEKHRVFWKEKSSTVKALRRWTGPQITAALDRVRRAERAVMLAGPAGATIALYETLAVSRAAARR